MPISTPDAIVVGSGPNGLAAAITLARAGLAVRVYEGATTPGGGLRSEALTLPGFVHDPCATVVVTALVSPFFRALGAGGGHGPLDVALAQPAVPAAHLLAPDRPVLLHRDLDETAAGLGRDGGAWRALMAPLVREEARILPWVLGPLTRLPRHPLAAARFGPPALLPAAGLAALAFRDAPARSLYGALAAHGMVPLEGPASAGFGLVLAMAAHAVGWPVVAGGTQRLTDALVVELRRLGGEVVTGTWVTSLRDLPPARAVLIDVAPPGFVGLAGPALPEAYRRALLGFRFGPGACKVDWALDGPIPWRAPELVSVGTVHLGGDLGHVRGALAAVNRGRLPARPFVILVQASAFDPTRAPAGAATAWAYAHVPNGWRGDLAPTIEALVEEAAPGFGGRIMARHVRTAQAHAAANPNAVGGEIGGGAMDLVQLVRRPVLARDPYRTPLPGVYLCSASTPPGGGVHGMSGYHAARSALRREFGVSKDPLGIS